MSEDFKKQRDYSTAIPNILLDIGLNQREFHHFMQFFIRGINIPNKTFKSLLKKGVVKNIKYSDKQILQIIKSKIPQKLEMGRNICEWCLGSTLILHQHHFPISLCDGGKEVVKICASCHAEYHFLKDSEQYEINSEFKIVVKK